MKRLNCTYEPKKDTIYPWLLKHPKIKEGLAKFKTRTEALEWYMLLNFETAIWFQNDKNIFDGQLTCDSEKDEWYYYVKTSIFDGGATYEGVCHELSINPATFQIDREALAEKVKNFDFVLISDPQTYFPEKLEMAKKKAKKDLIDIDAIKSQFQEQINILLQQINKNNAEADKELEFLKQELAKKDSNFEELSRRMDQLKQNYNPLESVVYEELPNLKNDDLVGAVALYTEKIRAILKSFKDQKICKENYEAIKKNYQDFDSYLTKKEQDPNFSNAKLIENMHNELKILYDQLLSKLAIDENLSDEPTNFAYYKNEKTGENVSVAYETSYVLVELMHTGFVPKEEYHYPIPKLATRAKYAVTVINANDTGEIITIESGEFDAPEENPKDEEQASNLNDIQDAPKESFSEVLLPPANEEASKLDAQQEEFVEPVSENILPEFKNEYTEETSQAANEEPTSQIIEEDIVEEKQAPLFWEAKPAAKVEQETQNKVEESSAETEEKIVEEKQAPLIWETPQAKNEEPKEETKAKDTIQEEIIWVEEQPQKNLTDQKQEQEKSDFVLVDHKEPSEKPLTDFVVMVETEKPIQKAENTAPAEMPTDDFYTGIRTTEQQALLPEESKPKMSETKTVEEKPKREKSVGFWFLAILLILVLLGLITVNVLAILQLLNVITVFPI